MRRKILTTTIATAIAVGLVGAPAEAAKIQGVVVAKKAQRHGYLVARPTAQLTFVRTTKTLRIGSRVKVWGKATAPGVIRAARVKKLGRGGKVRLHGRLTMVAGASRVRITGSSGSVDLLSGAVDLSAVSDGDCVEAKGQAAAGTVTLVEVQSEDRCESTSDDHDGHHGGGANNDSDDGTDDNGGRNDDSGHHGGGANNDNDDAGSTAPGTAPAGEIEVRGLLTVGTTNPLTVSVKGASGTTVFLAGAVDLSTFSTGDCVQARGRGQASGAELVELRQESSC